MLTGDGELTDARVIVVIANDPEQAAAGERAVRMAGPVETTPTGWPQATAAIGAAPRLAAVYADARGVADAELSRLLPTIADAVADVRLVVELAQDQIDAVAAAMLPIDTILLCEPSAAERATALALAAPTSG